MRHAADCNGCDDWNHASGCTCGIDGLYDTLLTAARECGRPEVVHAVEAIDAAEAARSARSLAWTWACERCSRTTVRNPATIVPTAQCFCPCGGEYRKRG